MNSLSRAASTFSLYFEITKEKNYFSFLISLVTLLFEITKEKNYFSNFSRLTSLYFLSTAVSTFSPYFEIRKEKKNYSFSFMSSLVFIVNSLFLFSLSIALSFYLTLN